MTADRSPVTGKENHLSFTVCGVARVTVPTRRTAALAISVASLFSSGTPHITTAKLEWLRVASNVTSL